MIYARHGGAIACALRTVAARRLRLTLLATTAFIAFAASLDGVCAQAVINGGTETVPGTKANPWNIGNSLTIGGTGTGGLNIGAGGLVTNTFGAIGALAGSNGTVDVSGAGASWVNSGSLQVGVLGTGHLTISAGGSVTNTLGSVGYGVGSVGTVTVTGAGSTWSNSSTLSVGYNGTGTLTIANGGSVSDTLGVLSEFADGKGTAVVTGAGSVWTNTTAFFVGGAGTGDLTVSNGGKVVTAYGYIGGPATATGTAIVTGAGSAWTNSADLLVGNAGTGALTIAAGGTVTANNASIGSKIGAAGGITVDGANSRLTVANELRVGDQGLGLLTISNGGQVTNANGYIGFGPGYANSVTVTGAGSSWTNTSGLMVGYGGEGTLIIANGGKVVASSPGIGLQVGATGSVTVDGAGSVLDAGNYLYLGYRGSGVVTVANGGTIKAIGLVDLAQWPTSAGVLNIGAAAGQPAAAPGTLETPLVQFDAGAATLVFNHTGSAYSFAPVLAGTGTINHIAGTTILTADSSGYTGVVNVLGGRLAVNGSLAHATMIVAGGTLGGSGTIGTLTAGAGGIIAPGNSIGTLTVAGNVGFAPGSTYQVEVNAAGQSDKLVATGTATLSGTVQVLAAPGVYAPSTTYTILTAAGGITGTFGGVISNFAFLAPTLSYDGTNAFLTLMRNDTHFQDVGVTANQKATGAGLDSLPVGQAVVASLVQLDAASARAAFDQLSGEAHASVKGAAIEDSRFVREAAMDRLRAAFGTVGAAAGQVTVYAADGPSFAAPTTDRFAVWGRGFGAFGRWSGDGNAAALRRDIGGFFLGGDGLVAEAVRLGLVSGYSRSSFRAADRQSTGASDNFHLGLYGGSQWGDLAVRAGAAYTWQSLSTGRTVAFAGFGDILKASYTARTAQVFGELGYRIRVGRTAAGTLAFEPFAAIAYVNLSTDAFTEQGAAAALAGRGDTTAVTFTTLGLRAASAFMLDGGTQLTVRGTLGWRHAFGDTTPFATLAFAGGAPFTIAGVPIARDAAVVEAGLDVSLTPAATLGLSYGGQFGSGATDQTIKGTLGVRF